MRHNVTQCERIPTSATEQCPRTIPQNNAVEQCHRTMPKKTGLVVRNIELTQGCFLGLKNLGQLMRHRKFTTATKVRSLDTEERKVIFKWFRIKEIQNLCYNRISPDSSPSFLRLPGFFLGSVVATRRKIATLTEPNKTVQKTLLGRTHEAILGSF